MAVDLKITTLGDKFQDYRNDIRGDSFNWGPEINTQQITSVTIHHSVTSQTAKNDGNWKAECDKIAKFHLARGWAGVGYRIIICSDGTAAYVGDLSHGGSGVANHNHETFSICLVGDFTKELPTDEQIKTSHEVVKWFLFNMPQYPNLKSWDQMKGHKEWNATACPGTNWKGVSDSIYERIKNKIPYTPERNQPQESSPDDVIWRDDSIIRVGVIEGIDFGDMKLSKLRDGIKQLLVDTAKAMVDKENAELSAQNALSNQVATVENMRQLEDKIKQFKENVEQIIKLVNDL